MKLTARLAPNEWRVIPGIDVGGPTSDQFLGRGKLDTPSHDIDEGDGVKKAAGPTMSRTVYRRRIGHLYE